LGLVLMLVVATGYLMFGALQANPFASSYRVTIALPESGGLLPNQDVTLRGVPIGRVERLDITPNGVDAVVSIDSTVRIPQSAAVRVSGLSPAGEQYIDFVPSGDDDAGPYLADGARVGEGTATVPVTLAELLANADGALAQADTAKLELIRRELSLSPAGPQKLKDIIDGGTFLLSTLDSVLPETSSLLRTSRVVFTLIDDKNAGLAVAADNLDETFTGIDRMKEGYRRLTDQTPGVLEHIDALFADNSDTMVQLLGNLTTTSRLLYLRTRVCSPASTPTGSTRTSTPSSTGRPASSRTCTRSPAPSCASC
ncbi:mce related family protein, partial [Mycolicibacterium hassiacum DSM 44199]